MKRLWLALWDSDPYRWPVAAIAGTIALIVLVLLEQAYQ